MSKDQENARPATVQERPIGHRPTRVKSAVDRATVQERPAGAAPSFSDSLEKRLAEDEPQLTPEEVLGKVIDGRYKVLAPLAEGGMGTVFLAEQMGLERKVALKLLVTEDPEHVERFQREAVALAEVSHPAIVEIYDFTANAVEASNRGCLAMAYIDGMDLADYLEQQPEKRLSVSEVVDLMIPIVSALVELHANGIIHRDIKPANLVRFLRADGRPGLKLVDFGIARRQVDPGMTASGLVLGTPPYLPPEAFLGERATPLSDIYALAATMFELLTGDPPFIADTQAQILQRTLHEEPKFPPALLGTPIAELLGKMLTKVPRNRPDALQVLHALEQVRAGQQPSLPGAPGPRSGGPTPTVALKPARARIGEEAHAETAQLTSQSGAGNKMLLTALFVVIVALSAVVAFLAVGK